MKMKTEAAEDQMEEGQKQSMWNHGEHWLRGKEIGQGAFGTVYRATAKKPRSCHLCGVRRFPDVIAVKSAEISAASTIQDEGNILFAIKGSPFVIERLGEELTTTENGETIYNLMLEYASGGTLYGLIRTYNGYRVPEREVGQHTKSILEGIKHIHNCGYVHCDLKPENILLVPNASGNLVAKVADLGLAKRSKEGPNGWAGTRRYTDPEALIYGVQDQPSDIWSIGCMVLEMLTGNNPWNTKPGLKSEEFLDIVVLQKTPKIPDEVSDVARDFLKSCLAPKASERLTVEKLLLHPFVAQPEALQVVDDDDQKPVVVKPRRVAKNKRAYLAEFQLQASEGDDADDQKPVVTKRRRVSKDKKGYLVGFQPARARLTVPLAQ